MKRQHKLATWMGALLGTLCALLFAAQAHGADRGRLREEFHQTYSVSPNGRVSLENINGAVRITAWDRHELKVDAVKYANSRKRLDEAKIRVDASPDSVSIRTEYIGRDQTFNHDDEDNPAGVEYTLTVPKGARLDGISLINGALDVQGIAGEVKASCINGKLTARGLSGRVRLSTVNSRVDALFDHLSNDSPIELSSVNGPVQLTVPSDAKAEVEASTVHGAISNDFGLHVHDHQPVGHNLRAEIGGGGTRIKLANVNGTIEVRHVSDGRTLSPGKDLDRERHGDDDEI